MLDSIVVGQVIQRLREKKKLSQEVVSGLAGIGRTHLSAIERGERKPTLETFFRIADALRSFRKQHKRYWGESDPVPEKAAGDDSA